MHAVANSVDPDLPIFDIRHNITPFDIAEAAGSLNGNLRYWPPGTVFVSVVDPGVGTLRRSVVLKTKTGHYIVSPDNGSLALVADGLGIEAVREIDESVNRIKGSDDFHTFHGRDVYSFTGARLASGTITYEEVGPLLDPRVAPLDRPAPAFVKGGAAHGTLVSAGGTEAQFSGTSAAPKPSARYYGRSPEGATFENHGSGAVVDHALRRRLRLRWGRRPGAGKARARLPLRRSERISHPLRGTRRGPGVDRASQLLGPEP